MMNDRGRAMADVTVR